MVVQFPVSEGKEFSCSQAPPISSDETVQLKEFKGEYVHLMYPNYFKFNLQRFISVG